jgi:hypothetical protein
VEDYLQVVVVLVKHIRIDVHPHIVGALDVIHVIEMMNRMLKVDVRHEPPKLVGVDQTLHDEYIVEGDVVGEGDDDDEDVLLHSTITTWISFFE